MKTNGTYGVKKSESGVGPRSLARDVVNTFDITIIFQSILSQFMFLTRRESLGTSVHQDHDGFVDCLKGTGSRDAKAVWVIDLDYDRGGCGERRDISIP